MVSYLIRVWSCRYFWLSLVKIDLRNRYRRSVLGIGWSLLRPILMTVILCIVFQRLFKRSDTFSFAPFLLAGLCCWDYIVTATKQGCQCFFQGESYIRQYPAPLAIFPLRIALTETFHFFVGLFVLISLSWYLHGFSNLVALLSLLPSLCLFFIFVWAMALLAGCANVYFQDTQHLCDVFFQILFYATPIVYNAEDLGHGRLYWFINHFNPFVPFLQLIREPVLSNSIPSLATYSRAFQVVLVCFSVSALLCARLQRRLIFRL